MTKLVVVESPAKVETIRDYLPSDFEVDSCVGHVRDLPRDADEMPAHLRDEAWADYGVNVDEGFEPVYVTIDGKADVLRRLRSRLDEADELWLATDEDREGESISWHLVQELEPEVPVKRMVFNEITRDAVEAALEDPREVDMDLVEAQQTRRILDRLYGYTLSPLLWDKIRGGLSAGRVQSPAVRLVVMRERERRAFESAEYWDLEALLADDGRAFEARLHELDGTRVAEGGDFDEDTGRLEEGLERVVLDEDQARALVDELEGLDWRVADVEERPRQSSPPAPFKTSTLQQAANSRLDLSPGHAMSVAQDLYEDGHITYMRTDSTHLSREGLEGARKAIADEWSPNLYEGPRSHGDETSEDAEEAHEAIRPAGSTFDRPGDTGLTGAHRELYDLIYRRTLASQMPNERYTSTTALVDAGRARFKATGKHVEFPGYRLAWPTTGRSSELPDLTAGQEVGLRELEPDGHETQPPRRFTEASLVDALEEKGIGRPSTYAEIISRIQEKDYVDKQGRSLVPTLTAFAVVGFLEERFPRLVDFGFTADMEEALDAIADGEAEALPYLEDFFRGEEGLEARVEAVDETVEGSQARAIRFEDLPYTVKVGRYGPYVEAEDADGDVVRANLPDDLTPDEIDGNLVERLVREEASGPETLGEDPDTGEPVTLRSGRYGPYVQLGHAGDADGKPPRASLPDDVDPDDVDLDLALWLLSLPRELGEHPDGGRVLAGIGRYGPYVCHDPPGEADRTYEDVPSWRTLRGMRLEEALERLEGDADRRGVLREVGEHPDTGATIELRTGRYGPYLSHRGDNKSLPDELDVGEVTREDAVFLVGLPETLGEHPDGGRLLKDWGRYGPYVAREDEDGDRTYASLVDYRDLREAGREEALFLLGLPETLGEHPDGGPVRIARDRDGAFLVREAPDGETLKTVRGLRAVTLRKMGLEDALAQL